MFDANAKFIQQHHIIMYLLFIRIETLEWIDFSLSSSSFFYAFHSVNNNVNQFVSSICSHKSGLHWRLPINLIWSASTLYFEYSICFFCSPCSTSQNRFRLIQILIHTIMWLLLLWVLPYLCTCCCVQRWIKKMRSKKIETAAAELINDFVDELLRIAHTHIWLPKSIL